MINRFIKIFTSKKAKTTSVEPDTTEEIFVAPTVAESKSAPRWEELYGITPGSRPAVEPTRDFSDLSNEERDLWQHKQRMKKIDEAEIACKKYGTPIKLMHLSALSPVTRKSHAERHGKLFTFAEARSFWEIEENIKGCKCSISEIMVDEAGIPIVPGIVELANKQYNSLKDKYGNQWI